MINLDSNKYELKNGLYNYVIFDDFDLKSGSWMARNYKPWWGAQEHIVGTDKYVKKLDICHGKTCIILSNDNPTPELFISNGYDWNWVQANVLFFHLLERLY